MHTLDTYFKYFEVYISRFYQKRNQSRSTDHVNTLLIKSHVTPY